MQAVGKFANRKETQVNILCISRIRTIIAVLGSAFLCLYADPVIGFASECSYIRQKWDADDGLSDRFVNTVFCDSRGIIWIGTQFGVDWYDGNAFRNVVIPERSYVRVLPNSIFEDENNQIIVCTFRGLIILGDDGKVKRQVDIPLSRELVHAPDGKLWTASSSRGLRSIDLKDYSVKTYPYFGISVSVDESGDVYHLDTNGNIFRIHNQSNTPELFLEIEKSFSKILTCKGKLFLFNDQESRIYDIKSRKLLKSGFPGIERIAEDNSGRIWLATTQGIYSLNSRLELTDMVDVSGAHFMKTEGYICICCDREGGIWLGSASGLEHLSPNRWNVKQIKLPSAGLVVAMTTDEDGYMWIATQNKGLFRYHPSTGEVKTIPIQIPTRHVIRTLYADGDYLWISTWNVGDHVVRLHRKTLETSRQNHLPGRVGVFYRDSQNHLWLGANQCSGYEENGNFVRTSHSQYSTIVEDRSGLLWTGIKTNGITRHNADESETRFNSELGNFKSRCLLQLMPNMDAFNVLTEGDGLFFYDTDRDSFVPDNRFPYYRFGRLRSASWDSSGRMWIISRRGFIYYNMKSGAWSFLERKEILNDALDAGALCLGRDDELFIGASDGFYAVNKNALMKNWSDVQIVFTSFSVIQSTVRRNVSFSLEDRINNLERINLPHNCNSFRINMTDVNLNGLNMSRLAYRLDGYSDNWEPVVNGEVSFLNIPTGTYDLFVRNIGADGSFLGKERHLGITVMPSAFASPWAILFYIGFFICVLIVVVRVSVRKTEEKAAATAILREAEREKALYASKVEFLSSLVHEIRTPLSLVKLPIESLSQYLSNSKNPVVKEDIDTILRNSEVLSQLIDELLDFQKLEKAGYKLEISKRDISSIIKEVVGRFRFLYENKNIDFTLDLQSGPCVAAVDTRVFDRILTNLLSNAAKYSQTYVKCSLFRKDGDFLFVIENDGEIVPLGMRDKIFNAFVRYEGARHYVEGTGIGLYTSKTFAELLGGNLRMDEDISVNRFIFSLPCVRDEGVTEMSDNASEAESFVQPLRKRHILLIVEDNDELVRIIQRNFEDEYDVFHAGDGLEALAIMESGHIPSIVISDVMMPNMDGFELCRKIKTTEKYATIPIILLTAKTVDDSQIQAFESGADAFVKKPFSMVVLQAMVKSVLENREKLGLQFASGHVLDTAPLEYRSPDNKLLIKVQEYFAANISNVHIKMEDVAAYCSISLSSFQKKMKRITGMSPTEYLLKFRMKEAVRLLVDRSLPVSDISIRLGFISHSYFSNCFKKEYGVTPRQWRNQQGK